MSKNYCECLAEIYIARKEEYDDWNKHISCLCSRVIIRSYVPNTFSNHIESIEDQHSYEQEECDAEIDNFDLNTEDEKIISQSPTPANLHEKGIFKKRIHICEFDCIFTLYLVSRENNSLDQYHLRYKEIQCHNKLLNKFNIFLGKASLFFDRKILNTIIELFILKDLNFINNYILNFHEQQVAYHLLVPQTFHQLQHYDIIGNYKLLHYYRFADYLLSKSSFQFQWEDFWSNSGDYIIKLSWTLKYRDYINPDQLNAIYDEIWKISENDRCSSIKQAIQEQIINLKAESAIVSKYKKLRKFTNSEILSVKYNKQLSLIISLRTQLENNSVLESDVASVASPNDSEWLYLWQNHYQEQYTNCYVFFHEYCIEQSDILKKICFISNFLKVNPPSQFCIKRNLNRDLLINFVNKTLKNVHWDFYKKVIYESIVPEQLLQTNEFYKYQAPQYTYKSSNENVSDECEIENDSYTDIDEVVNALKRMGFAHENNMNGDKLKGEVIFKKKNITFHRRYLKNKWSYINQFPVSEPNEMHSTNGENDIDSSISSIINDSVTNVNADSTEIATDMSTDWTNETDSVKCEDDQKMIDMVHKNLIENLETDQKQNDDVEVKSDSCKTKRIRKNKKRSKKKSMLPEYVQKNPMLKKYWAKRYRLFSKFDEGIKLDDESWFSVTPEKVAKHIAERCRCDILIDAFCGAGGNSISFAFTCERVYAIDIDPQKIEMARHNARIYGVENRIEFIIGDFFCIAERLFGDVVFLSPPWGGPSYIQDKTFDIQNIMDPHGGMKLLEVSKKISDNIGYFLPKNINTLQLAMTAGPGSKIELEQNFLDSQLIAVTAYYGELSR